MCPLRGQSLESRLAAQRSVVRTLDHGLGPMRRATSLLILLHVANLTIPVSWWLFGPGEAFDNRALSLSVSFATVWSLAAFARRRVLTPLTATGVVALGTALAWVWIIGIWAGLLALAFAVTGGVLGVIFVLLWPLLAWGAFLAVHFGSRWLLSSLQAA